jgi:hypothetical protein
MIRSGMPDNPILRLPNGTQRASVMGHTGSGKTHLSMWLLSHANFHKQPWVIVDYKYDDFFRRLNREVYRGITEIDVHSKVPRSPGLYVMHPLPTEHDELNDFLMRVWSRERVGLFFDEGHMLPKAPRYPSVPTLLTQGRSKRIPIIMVTQKPSWVSQFAFSEADFFSVFHMNDWRDRQRVMEFVPVDLEHDLPERHSYWHDVARRDTKVLLPLPDRDTILSTFKRRVGERKGLLWNASSSHGPLKTSLRWF